jgi:hypothetical protein
VLNVPLSEGCSTKLAPVVIVRPVEWRKAKRTEFSLADGEWRNPRQKMKMRRPPQAIIMISLTSLPLEVL